MAKMLNKNNIKQVLVLIVIKINCNWDSYVALTITGKWVAVYEKMQ